MAFVICEPCVNVKDTACVAVCPVDCIYDFGDENQLFIHPEECIDCAACQPECPVQAIFPEASVPSQWQSYIDINRRIFETRPLPTHQVDTDDARATPVIATDGVAAPVSSAEVNALRELLNNLHGKTVSPQDALTQVVPILEKLGISVK